MQKPLTSPTANDDIRDLWMVVAHLVRLVNALRKLTVRATGRSRFDWSDTTASLEIPTGNGGAAAASRLPWQPYATGTPLRFKIQPGLVQSLDGDHEPARRNIIGVCPRDIADNYYGYLVANCDVDGKLTSLDFGFGATVPASTLPVPGSLAGTYYRRLFFLTSNDADIDDYSNVFCDANLSLLPQVVSFGTSQQTRVMVWSSQVNGGS